MVTKLQISRLFRQGAMAAIRVVLNEDDPQTDPHWLAGYKAGKDFIRAAESAHLQSRGMKPFSDIHLAELAEQHADAIAPDPPPPPVLRCRNAADAEELVGRAFRSGCTEWRVSGSDEKVVYLKGLGNSNSTWKTFRQFAKFLKNAVEISKGDDQ